MAVQAGEANLVGELGTIYRDGKLNIRCHLIAGPFALAPGKGGEEQVPGLHLKLRHHLGHQAGGAIVGLLVQVMPVRVPHGIAAFQYGGAAGEGTPEVAQALCTQHGDRHATQNQEGTPNPLLAELLIADDAVPILVEGFQELLLQG